MIPKLVSNSDDVDFIVTGSPSEALVLEKQLIRKHKPRYNSMFKDDKSYPFIAITNTNIHVSCTQGGRQKVRRYGAHFQMPVLLKES